MNDDKLGELFAAARRQNPCAPAQGFDVLVMQAIKHEPALPAATVAGQLDALFPRVAWAAVVFIALCLAGDWFVGSAQPDLADGVTLLSQQWLPTGGGL